MAAADAGYAKAGQLAEAAVRETGMGVAVDKKTKNEMASRGIYDRYREHDYCSRQVRANELIVDVPRPAGVILALTPSSNPVCTIFSNIMLALMTRNAIVILPERAAKSCSIEAARTMATAATRAGAPAGTIQMIEQLNPNLIELRGKFATHQSHSGDRRRAWGAHRPECGNPNNCFALGEYPGSGRRQRGY